MAKAAKKRTVTCGKCGEQGHNARSCKPAAKEIKSSKDIPPPPKNPGTKTRVDERFEQTLAAFRSAMDLHLSARPQYDRHVVASGHRGKATLSERLEESLRALGYLE